jgi:transposase
VGHLRDQQQPTRYRGLPDGPGPRAGLFPGARRAGAGRAPYDPATGALYGHLHDRKTWREIRELLRSLRARFNEHLIVVLDNFSPHKKTELQAWVAEHDIELVFTPTYSSWLNLIECQFQALRSFVLNGSDYQSHADQDAAIRAYLRWHNRNTRPAKPWRLNAEVHHSLPDVAA